MRVAKKKAVPNNGGLAAPPHSGLIKPLHSGLIKLLHGDNMANKNVPAPTPTRSDDQILPFGVMMPIGKSNYLDEDWFTLDANLLREALKITPIDQAHQFESPPSGNAIMDFVNELGYLEELHFVSRMAISSSLDALGIITRTNVDYVELMWEEFIQDIQTFLADKANLGIATKKDKKT
ncbi:hypothetical protein Tco_0347356 [Tanacetum coccineum]